MASDLEVQEKISNGRAQVLQLNEGAISLRPAGGQPGTASARATVISALSRLSQLQSPSSRDFFVTFLQFEMGTKEGFLVPAALKGNHDGFPVFPRVARSTAGEPLLPQAARNARC
jgi:hypothetical protein